MKATVTVNSSEITATLAVYKCDLSAHEHEVDASWIPKLLSHLSEEVDIEVIGPDCEFRDTVNSWLLDAGLEAVVSDPKFISAKSTPIEQFTDVIVNRRVILNKPVDLKIVFGGSEILRHVGHRLNITTLAGLPYRLALDYGLEKAAIFASPGR